MPGSKDEGHESPVTPPTKEEGATEPVTAGHKAQLKKVTGSQNPARAMLVGLSQQKTQRPRPHLGLPGTPTPSRDGTGQPVKKPITGSLGNDARLTRESQPVISTGWHRLTDPNEHRLTDPDSTGWPAPKTAG